MAAANNGCYVDSPRNLWVEDGAAHVTARIESQPFTCPNPYGPYASQVSVAALTTATKFAQAYGRFEFRARFPDSTAPGLHSALWLYPARHHYGRWPRSGEIDVAEWWSARPTYVIPSVHYQGEPAPHSSGLCTMADPWNWHRYAVEWTASYMRFLHDGVECFRHSWTPDPPLVSPQPFDQPFYIVLTQAFGSEWNAVTAATPRVATLEVDWVRAWR
jgi:beta-glucanase (GH16 family)